MTIKRLLHRNGTKNIVLNYICTFSFLIFPIFPFFSSIALILFSVFAFPSLSLKHLTIENFKVYCSFIAIYLVYLLAFFYSPNIERGLELLIRLLPIPLIIGLFIFGGLNRKLDFERIKIAYLIGVFLSALITFISAALRAYNQSDISEIFYFALVRFIHSHPTYFSLQIITALAIVLDFLKRGKQRITILLIFFFSAIMMLLQSKMGILMLLVLFISNAFDKKTKFFTRVSVLTICISIIFGLAISLANSNNRFSELTIGGDKLNIGTNYEDGVHQRKWLWSNAWKQYVETPFFGHGLGSQKNVFIWKIEKTLLEARDLDYAIVKASKRLSKFNLHNQYLQLLYETGIIGLLIFLLGITGVLISLKRPFSGIFGFVYVSFMVFLFTENMLDRQMGIYFYSFLLILLFSERYALQLNQTSSDV